MAFLGISGSNAGAIRPFTGPGTGTILFLTDYAAGLVDEPVVVIASGRSGSFCPTIVGRCVLSGAAVHERPQADYHVRPTLQCRRWACGVPHSWHSRLLPLG